jgi:Leucine-rich repeat (LRR) protein
MKKLSIIITFVTILILGNGTSWNAIAKIPAIERAALIAIYNSTNGDNWNISGEWKTPPLDVDGFSMPGTEDSWRGITVESDTVTEIGFRYCEKGGCTGFGLNGTIPPEIGNLTNLTRLYLDHNQLTSIPPEIGNLTNLTTLYLDHNQLTSIPPEIGNLVNLNYLQLHHNHLTSIPSEIGNFTKFVSLYLHHNHLTSIPPEMGTL